MVAVQSTKPHERADSTLLESEAQQRAGSPTILVVQRVPRTAYAYIVSWALSAAAAPRPWTATLSSRIGFQNRIRLCSGVCKAVQLSKFSAAKNKLEATKLLRMQAYYRTKTYTLLFYAPCGTLRQGKTPNTAHRS